MAALLEQYVSKLDNGAANPTLDTKKGIGSKVGSDPYTHGESGLFYLPDSQNGLVSLIMGSKTGGILGTIPVYTSDPYGTPDNVPNIFGATEWLIDSYLTGVTEGGIEDFSNQPTGDCVEAPEGGLMQLCTFYNPLARYRGSTREVSAIRAGRALNQLDARGFQLLNVPAMAEIFGTPDNMPEASAVILNEVAHRMWTLLFSFQRAFRKHVYTSTPASNSGEARFLTGINLHANAGNKYDINGARCAPADWVVKDMAYTLFDGSEGVSLYENIEIADHEARYNADAMGIEQIEGAIYMRSELFHLLTQVAPVHKFSEILAALDSLSEATQSRVMIAAETALRDRDTYRSSYMLPVNGRMQLVVVDNGITRKDNTSNPADLLAAENASDVYFIPHTVNGGMPCTFFDAFYQNNARTEQVVQTLSPNVFTFTTDNGLFRWYVTFDKGCVKMTFDLLPRLKIKFPVGWRIGNVAYVPSTSERSMFPSDSDYVDGGEYYGTTPTEPNGIWDYSDSATLD